MDQSEKIAIVTGAGSGIGRATAIALSKDNWIVVLSGRNKNKLLDTSQACTEHKTMVIPTDVTKPDSVKNLFKQTIEKYGRLDLLFNNAGVGAPSKPLEDITFEEWKRVIDTNLTGSFLCIQEAVRIMKNQDPQGGRIINNGSISAHVPRPFSAPYTASKHAVTGLTKSTSLDNRKYNIACGQIDIGNAASEMTKEMEKGIIQADGSTHIEPTMNVNEIGQTVVYMAGLSLDTNVPFITVMANGMPYMGRG